VEINFKQNYWCPTPASEPANEGVTADAGNSFGEALYGGRETLSQICSRTSLGSHGGPHNMSKAKD